MRAWRLGLALIVFGWSVDAAMAQVAWYRPYGYSPYGANYGGGYYAGGYSPVEGAQRGMADIVRAGGEAAESTSRARVSNEEARQSYLNNKLRWTEVYLERKRLHKEARAQEHAEDRERRQRYLASKRDRRPETLPSSMFDPQTGSIEWPEPLKADIYANYRRQIEEELEVRATSGTTANSNKIRDLARQMQSLLKDHIRDMPANEYIAGRKFLDRLVNQMAPAQTI